MIENFVFKPEVLLSSMMTLNCTRLMHWYMDFPVVCTIKCLLKTVLGLLELNLQNAKLNSLILIY